MSYCIRLMKVLVLLVPALFQWGCSSSNGSATQLNVSGQHPANWYVDHRAAYQANSNRCLECHGSDLRGGISKVSCFSSLFNGQTCHPQGPSGHPAGWRDPGLHGATAKSQPGPDSGFESCRPCHGNDFSGGFAGVSCFVASTATGSCHVRNGLPVGAPHAPSLWRTYPAPTHTNTVDDAAGSNAGVCAMCHGTGSGLKPGCFNNTLCHGVVGHPTGWAQPKNHGAAGKSNLLLCQQCHSDKPSGGPGSNPRFNVPLGRLSDGANGGCEVCHTPLAAHPRVLQIPAVFGIITTFNPLNTPWYLHCKADPSGFDACTRCHGANLDGVGAAAGATACTFCHRSGLPNTLKNCTSCHGLPPSGTVYPNIARAHGRHATINVADVCGECHLGIGSVTLDHFNRAKAHTTSIQPGAVIFGAFSKTDGLAPVYAEANLQCTNTYCHGATIVGGANKSPRWNDANYLTAAGCGTCHGFPPANAAHQGLTSATSCKICHPHVNAANTGFDDPTRHVNGGIDVTGGAAHAFPYPGAVHVTVAGAAPFAGCVATGCHTNSVANRGAYPVGNGIPPDCQGCHVKAAPGNSCGSCHGTAANGGRPTGTAFPDVAGRHGGSHTSFACTLCHGVNGTGQTSHGPSNRTAHGDANVVIQFTGEATGITFTRSGLGNGHGTCTGTCHGEGHDNRNW